VTEGLTLRGPPLQKQGRDRGTRTDLSVREDVDGIPSRIQRLIGRVDKNKAT
jgi:hypothetical protein